MTISKGWYIFLGSVLLSVSSLYAEKLETQLSPPEIQPGEHAFFDLKLHSEAGDKASDNELEIAIADDLLMQHKQIKVLDKKFIKEENIPTFRYEITAYEAGELRLPPIQVKWGGNQLSTESTPFKIVSTREATDDAIRDAFGEVSRPLPLLRIAKLILIAIITYFLCWIIWPWMQKLPGLIPKQKVHVPVIREEDPLVWLKRELERFKTKKKMEAENPELIDDWYQIVKTFFAKREKKSVRAWTTVEFKSHLATNKEALGIAPCLETCDVLKFSSNKNFSISETVDHWILQTEKILLCGS